MASTSFSALTPTAPLTTIFTPPPGCLERPTLFEMAGYDTLFTRGSLWSVYHRPEETCFPPAPWTANNFKQAAGDGWVAAKATYSPGLFCPSGYVTGTQTTVISQTTIVGCCPLCVESLSHFAV